MSSPRSSLSPTATTSLASTSTSISTNSCQSSISIITCSSNTTAASSSHIKPYTSERIKFLLKQHSSTYTVIKNEKVNSNASTCWQVFGFPAKKSASTDEFEKIEGFASCRTCYQTFVHSSTSGTRNMISHSCVKNLTNTKITTYATASSPSNQTKINSVMNNYKQVKLNEKEINIVKNLACSWICHDMRSFKIIEDNGLKGLLQEFIVLGKLFCLLSYLLYLC
jgi:hypothetical protein